jgi:hypothetical protein
LARTGSQQQASHENQQTTSKLINGERSAAFTPLRFSIAKYQPEINRLANVEAG